MRAVALVIALLAVGAASASAAPATGPMRGEIPLRVDESTKRFDVPTRKLIVRPGVVKFTVLIPQSARKTHAVGIDGGQYRNIAGAPVRPGRSTSLTVQLRPGNYTVYDAHKANRKAGYYVKVTVLKNKGGRIDFGKACESEDFFGSLLPQIYATNISCADADELGSLVNDAWRANDYAWDPLTVDGFTCTLAPFTSAGLTTTCVRGDQRVVWVG